MGYSCSAKIAFGIAYSEHGPNDKDELPWYEDGGDLESWYRGIKGFAPKKVGEDWAGYHLRTRAFDEKHPCPVEEVSFGFEAEGIILTPSKVATIRCDWSPEEFDVKALHITPEQIQEFKDFFSDHNIPLPQEPSWLLASSYG